MTAKRRDSKGRVLRTGESQRSDGRYVFRYTDTNGREQSVYSWRLVNTDKIKEGQRDSGALRDIEKQILKDLDDQIKTREANRTTVDKLFDQFMSIRTDLRETTRCCYRNMYEKHVKNRIGGVVIGQLKPTDIQRLYSAIADEDRVAATTVQKIHSFLYQTLENAVMDNLVRLNPASNAFRNFRKTADLTSKERNPLTEEEQARFLQYVYSTKEFKRMANLVTVLIGTGLRISEALGLRYEDCDMTNGIIHVNHELLYKTGEDGKYRYRISTPKTRAGYRIVPMMDDVKTALKREMKKVRREDNKFTVDGYTGFIFLNSKGKVYTQSFVFDTLQRIRDYYNAEEAERAREEKRTPVFLPKLSAHIMRHTFCSRMCENDANLKDLQDIMGHRNIRTTMETYTKTSQNKKIETIKSMNGAFKISYP